MEEGAVFEAIVVSEADRKFIELHDYVTHQLIDAIVIPRSHLRRLECDGCGAIGPLGTNWHEARATARADGWQYARERLSPGSNCWTYKDYCSRCREKGAK